MFSLFKRKEVELSPAAMQRLLGAAQLRHRLDTIYANCGFPRVEGSIERELGRLAAFGAISISATIGISVGDQTDDCETLAIATLSIICADYLSQQSRIDFQELAAQAVVYMRLADDRNKVMVLHMKALAIYAALADTVNTSLLHVGQAFAEFFATADVDALTSAEPHAARLLEIIRSSLSE